MRRLLDRFRRRRTSARATAIAPTAGEWAGRVARPNETFQPICWGFGFSVRNDAPEALGIAVVTPDFEALARIRVWRLKSSAFSPPTDLVSDDRHPLNLPGRPHRFPTMAWFPLPALAPGLYAADISLLVDGTPRPFGIGVYTAPEWSWRAGYFNIAGGPVRPTKPGLGVVWDTGNLPREPERVFEVDGIDIPRPIDARYDLISIDDSGRRHLTLGRDREHDPEEFAPATPTGHAPRFVLYTTRSGAEIIPVEDWQDGVRRGEEEQHRRWLEECRERLPMTLAKLAGGEDLVLAGYGDSITALGARSPDQLMAPNGKFRDRIGYFANYGEDWKAFAALPDGHHRLGWNWVLKAAMEERWRVRVRYDNWGLAGTTSGPDTKEIDGFAYPNAGNPERLKRMLDTRPDLVTVAVGTNDIGDPVDTRANVIAIGRAIREAGAELIVIAPPKPKASSYVRDERLWRFTHDRVVEAARELQAACLPTADLYDHPGALGLSPHSHGAAQSPWHPGARELTAIGRYLSRIFD